MTESRSNSKDVQRILGRRASELTAYDLGVVLQEIVRLRAENERLREEIKTLKTNILENSFGGLY